MKIRGSVALVTGASSGIGAAIARDLAARGATVVGVARRAAELEAVIADCPGGHAHVADVSDRAAAEAAVRDSHDRYGRVDIVVNNAGISLHKPAQLTTTDDIERVMSVNFLGAVYVAQAALPGMLERRRGSIVNITSVAGYLPNPGESAYGASKAALSLWSHGLSVDLHGTGVHVGVVSPGPIDTEIWAKDEFESSYTGRMFPASVVADAVADVIEHETVHRTTPRRYGAVGALYPVLGRPMRRGLIEFERRGRARAQRQ